MDSQEIKLLTFVTPHLFYITKDIDAERRTTFLNTLSSRIKKCLHGSRAVCREETISTDEILAVIYESGFARATVLDKVCFKEGREEIIYFCWLIDYAILIKTDKVFKLPGDIQKITPRSRQASLSNICYLREHLELGVTGVVKKIPSLVPHSGVVQYCLDLLANYDKLTFKDADRRDNILIGEVLIHKGDNVLYLTNELCAKGLVTINELMFQNLICCTKEYMKTHLKTIYQVCKETQNIPHSSSADNSFSPSKHFEDLDNKMEVFDMNTPPLENGRRRKTLANKPAQLNLEAKMPEESKSPLNSQNKDANLSRGARLLQKLKARKSVEAVRQDLANTSSSSNPSKEDSSSVGYDSSTTAETKLESMEQSLPEAESDLESSSSIKAENSVSPFASITSEKKIKSGCVFFPAGMERSKIVSKKLSPSTKKDLIAESTSPNLQATTDEDCPTIKAQDTTKPSSEESESKPESTSSESVKSEIFTKQDFCKFLGDGCTCVQCKLTLEDDDWDSPINFKSADNGIKKKPESADLIIKPPKLLKPLVQADEAVAQQNEILSVNYSGMSVIEKKLSCKVLVHGESIPAPIRNVAQANMHREIYNTMSRINYKESKRIQHYAFPAITRNQHVFMVNDSKSGKTMAYLPVLMSFLMEKEQRYSQLFKMGGGPLMVILGSNSKKCEEIYDLAKIILNKQNRKLSLVTYPRYGNMSNVDVLITMPTILTNLLASRATNFKRLCHLVFEDADVILKSHNDTVKKFLNYADQVLEHRNCPKSIQLIMCARHWTAEMEDVLMKLNKVPMVCIGNHLEAALYGKMKFTMKFLDTGCKEQNLKRILHDKYKYTKSIIVCNTDELEDVQTFLTLKGIEFTSFLGVTQEEDILYLEAVWNSTQPGKYSVLLCTDDIYNTVNITSAQLLIHFSLPRSWSQFIKRFSCMLENIPSPLDNNQKKIEISSFVFIDENCEQRMSKFSNFIKIAGLEKELPINIKTFFEDTRQQQEYKRIAKKIDVCETVKVFGKCPSLYCSKRHILDKDLDASDLLPKNGSIKFKILKMLDAASCSIKLLEHVDITGKNVHKFEDLRENIAQTLAKTDMYYHPVSKPTVPHLYLHKEDNQYFRAKLVEMEEFAVVFLIDRGIYCKSKADALFKMPDELKDIPPQCYEARFANLIPPYKDNRFCRMAGQKAQFLLDSNCPDSVMTATVLLQLGDNLWLNDVNEYREMHDKSLPTIGFQFTRELVTRSLAVKDPKPLEELYDLCKKTGIELPEYRVYKAAVKRTTVVQVEPNWAFLDADAVHEVTFTFAVNPQELYIRQNKFTKQLLELEENIKNQIRKPFYPTPKDLKIGKCCLVKDQVTGHYVRGMILTMEDEKVEILCVDYADIVMDDVSNLKHITNDLITKLPFQSIQCSMHGIKPVDDDWTDAATDLLYTMAFEEDGCTFRRLFAKINAKQDNLLVKRQNSYSVTLKDGFTRRVLINELLVDCGFALPNGQEMQDFDLPAPKAESDDDSIEEIERHDDNDDNPIEDQDINFDAFDLEITDLADFMIALNLPVTKISDTPKQAGDKKLSTSGLPAIKATPAVDYLTPEVRWSQTDTHVKLSILVSDVISVRITVIHNRNFQFRTMKGGKEYRLNLLLFAKVDNGVQHTILGSQIRATLKKRQPTEWPRLLYTQEKVRKIYYDVSAMQFENEEERKRKPLQLDISDSSSEGEDDDKTPYFLCSDLDSDYDFDIPNDED